MSIEVKIDDHTAKVELIKREGNLMTVRVDDKVYDIDLMMVENGVYSILSDHISYNVELTEQEDQKHYNVNTLYNAYDVEIIDAETRYKQGRKGDDVDDVKRIFSPMPGKVVKILVEVGDEVKAGDTVIIVSAMKMESEYKVQKDRVVKEILVKEGDTIDGNQTLVVVE
jgi:biotin carboxyl carrier protein